jgi:steroid delta-isomerase-like uncharacterized protein
MPDNKARLRGFYAALEAGQDVDAAIDEYVAEDFVEHEELPGMGPTRETPRQMFLMMQAAFPDLGITVHDMVAEGDKVAARISFTGTHQGEFLGVPASGNQVTINGIDILQFRDGKVVAHWGVTDMGGAMAQMGAGPG